MEGSVAATQLGCGADRFLDKRVRVLDRVDELFTLRDIRSDRRRISAARSVCVLRLDPLRKDTKDVVTVEEDVDGIARRVSALHERRFRTHAHELLRGLL